MILVTGGTGLVGAHLLVSLSKKQQAIRAIYRDEKKLPLVKKVFSNFNARDCFDKIDWVKADLLNIPELSNAFKDATIVYHCAALVSFDPKKYHALRSTNIEGTANIVNLCISNNIKKLCYVSSVATLSKTAGKDTITETSYWNPEESHSIYGITKYGAEMEVWRGTQEGVPAIIVNPGVILGGGFWDDSSCYIFKKIHNGLTYYTKGTAGYVDVLDVVEIMERLMISKIENQNYIVVSDNWTYKNFLEQAATALHVEPPKKEASNILLNIAWRLDWLKSFLTGKDRLLTKHLKNTLQSTKIYSNEKVKKELDYNFTPIEKSINRISKQYLKEL
ncbi:NAD-dependent epimerase/dehydratase family protein [Mangrovimonas spongiae]|uniref:NAD-dependent epimerase/dehydratase family protein n=1 Tax=Mangrovimonas spongiae TaxID=2494697 RepID=A0A428K653_9FLAO|nr:NAD-dependent epimerase/dehydratase family protein [Mangrovimonas spongiae]RSK41842.1 NAD-dependent epimerase/dehydratase family protein [Mangrovimonas spongiae]